MLPQYLLLSIWYLTSLVIAKRGGSGGSSFGRGGGGSIGRSGGSHYPASHGLSGNTHYTSNSYHPNQHTNAAHSYPHTTGLSGNNQRSQGTSYTQKNEVHHHYHYSPPQQISYGSQHHPVFHGSPPVYVYEYRNSGSRFDNLLTGLALYNLGRMSGSHDHHHYKSEYRGTPGEVCKLGISKSNGEYEETRIDCKLISSFIWDLEREQEKSTTIIKTVNVTQIVSDGSNSTVTVTEALQSKGPSISVTPGMSCFMIRISRDSSILKRKVDCGLLQAYASRSLRYNRCSRVVPIISMFIPIIFTFL